MNIIKNASAVHTTAKTGRKIEYIVIHYTAGTTSRNGTAANTASYFSTTNTEVSADFIVDDGVAVQYNPDIKNRYTWHCGGKKYANKGGSFYGKCLNSNSIGIEICCVNSTGKMQNANDKSYSFTAAALDNAAELVRKLMSEYDIPAEKVIRHYDVNGKPCPGIIGWNTESGSDIEWLKFKQRIAGTVLKDEKEKMYRVIAQHGAFKNKQSAENFLKEVKKIYPLAYIEEV